MIRAAITVAVTLTFTAALAAALPDAASAQNQAAKAAPPAAHPRPLAKPQHPVAKPPGGAKDGAPPSEQNVDATPAGNGVAPDLAFGAFQRGFFLTAFSLATQRAEEKSDMKSMTLLGELYANGSAFRKTMRRRPNGTSSPPIAAMPTRCSRWRCCGLAGRAGPRDREASAKWLAAAAKLGHSTAAYDLALLYMEGQLFPQDFHRAAELLRIAADAGMPGRAICAWHALQRRPRRGQGHA